MAWQSLAGLRRRPLFGSDVRTSMFEMIRGESLPAPTLLKRLCSLFRWDATKVEKLVLLDRRRRQYGPTFWTVLGKNPRYEPLYKLWPYLAPAEQQLVIHLMRTYIAEKGRSAA
jgi:hypothetical protein